MMNTVPNVNFCAADAVGVNSQDLINSQGQFTTAPAQTAELPPDTFEKQGAEEKTPKKNNGMKILIGTLVAGLAAFAGLGYAVKSGHLKSVDLATKESFFSKLWARTQNVGHSIGEAAGKCWDSTLGKLFKKSAEETTKAS